MEWDQIEIKWAAMTRRIRADSSADRVDAKPLLTRRAANIDVKTEVIADRQVGMITTHQELPAE
jgi:hypothetical protein